MNLLFSLTGGLDADPVRGMGAHQNNYSRHGMSPGMSPAATPPPVRRNTAEMASPAPLAQGATNLHLPQHESELLKRQNNPICKVF